VDFAMPKQTGFNLVELMITVSLMAILIAFASPTFRETILNNRLATQANELLSALSLARSEALKNNVAAVVCKSSDHTDCSQGSWHEGWIVFADINGNGTLDRGSGDCKQDEDCVLRVYDKLSGGNTLTFTNPDNPDFISFNARGLLRPSRPGTFVLCDSRGDAHARHIVLTPTGYTAVVEKQAGVSCP